MFLEGPQGYTLLFNVIISDIGDTVGDNFLLHADDIKLFKSVADVADFVSVFNIIYDFIICCCSAIIEGHLLLKNVVFDRPV